MQQAVLVIRAWHDLPVFLAQGVEHVLGPGRHVYSNACVDKRSQASAPARVRSAECDAPPSPCMDHAS